MCCVYRVQSKPSSTLLLERQCQEFSLCLVGMSGEHFSVDCMQGTVVTAGRARAVVVCTGPSTAMGKIRYQPVILYKQSQHRCLHETCPHHTRHASVGQHRDLQQRSVTANLSSRTSEWYEFFPKVVVVNALCRGCTHAGYPICLLVR